MSRMAGVFVKGGYNYRAVPDVIALLPKGLQNRATIAYRCVMRLKAKGRLDERATDAALALESELVARELAEEMGVDVEGCRGWSPSLIQKGLHALDNLLDKLGVPLIRRQSGIGMAGRRLITIVPLAGKEAAPDSPAGPAAGPPPAPPPDTTVGTATTAGASSSSLAPLPGNGPEWPPGLLEAVGLVPDLSAERLRGWIVLGGADLAGRVAAWLRVWLLHPKAECRPRGAYWAEKTLVDWRRKLDGGLLTLDDIDRMIEEKVRKWGPKAAAAKADPERLAAEKARQEAEEARERRLRGRWGLLTESEREAIRAAVIAANPYLRRLPAIVVEAECLAELERREPSEPRAP